MGEQKLIAWRGNDVGVRLHVARVPARQSVVAPCWDVVSAEEMVNLTVDSMTNFLMSQYDEPCLRAFCGSCRQATGVLNKK